jgi:adenylate cyclase class IV
MKNAGVEIKRRGPLSKKQLGELKRFLEQKAKKLNSAFEQSIFFDTSIYPSIGDFETGFSRVSLKITGKTAVLRIKEGNPADAKREERTISIKRKDCSNLIHLLNSLGLKNGFYRPVQREDFQFRGLIISIKTNCVMGNHFEIESAKEIAITDPTIKDLLKKFKLFFWTKEEYLNRIHEKMKKSPVVNISDLNII